MGCYGSFSNNNYDGRFLFYFFKKENNETELCGYVVVLFYISHDNHEYVKWIRRKFCWKCMDCQHFFRQIFLGYFSDIVQAFDTLRKNVCGDDYTSLHNPIVLSSVLPAYGMFHSIQILFL